jgi:hypothetical protein
MRPTTLYHYASPSGFLGVIEHSAMWATDVRFLNDAQELRYAWDEFQRVLAERVEVDSPYREAYRTELDVVASLKATDLDEMEFRVFAACLSELSDDVPQWRSYASDGHGVALGFDAEQIFMLKVPYFRHIVGGKLEPLTADNTGEQMTWPAVLRQVTYGVEERQKAIAGELYQIEQACGTDDASSPYSRKFNLIHRVPSHLGSLAHVKHDGFKSEQEWRLTIQEHFPGSTASQISALTDLNPRVLWSSIPKTTVDVKFREGGHALFKPYTSVPFPKSALVEVVLGPNVKADLAKPVFRRLLDRHGFQRTVIRPSTMPYRT